MNLRRFLVCLQLLAWATLLCSANADTEQNILEDKTGETRLQEQDYSEVNFIYYTSDPTNFTIVPINQVDDLLNLIDVQKPTVFYAHGYTETPSGDSVHGITTAFIQRGQHNVVLVDWSKYDGAPYTSALENVPGVGKAVGEAIDSLVQQGLCSDDLWFIGHSLGAHVAGAVAEAVSFTWKRITGLDPAGPGYAKPLLTRESALVVDVVHTDAGVAGYNSNDGSIDFWPNGGHRDQPGCHVWEVGFLESVGCSHMRSWQFFAESVNDEQAFPAVPCSSYEDFQLGRCPPTDANTVYLGYAAAQARVEGSAYLVTASKSPFGLGAKGTEPAQ
ncbi:lipase member H-like [Thrips palmi]|uniref:Lipase member H-like n=1 Tax=Thrips palmi TaxID=161013 RepID=A0A6P8ZGS6_THRPL|nr:lipase member H-like [Thrips palmi]